MAPHEGLVHAKEYDVKDSNVEYIGSDIDHKVKYNSAATEPAWNNGTVGEQPGLYVWRIEDFQVVPWPKEKYGQFYDGDSFIILNSVKIAKEGAEKLCHDIFFWLGSHTTQDEAGAAAYKAVELDQFLHGSATQHREIQQSPSDEFLRLFPRMSIRKGGVRTGFHHVEEAPKENILTLLRVFANPAVAHGAKGLIVHEVDPTWESLDDSDVFVLDTGNKIWVWQGKNCSPMEKAKAAQVVSDMTLAKHIDTEVVSATEGRARRIIDLLGGGESTPRDFHRGRPVGSRRAADSSGGGNKKLFRLSDASGQLSFDLVKQGDRISHSDFDGNDVFLLDDSGRAVWVWEGQGASRSEKARWLEVTRNYIHRYLSSEESSQGYLTPVAKVIEGHESVAFMKVIEA